MADPIGTITSIIDAIHKAKKFYDYCHSVYEAGDTMKKLLHQTTDVGKQMVWLKEKYSLAVVPDSPHRELLSLYEKPENNARGWAEGPTIRELRVLLVKLERKLEPLEKGEAEKQLTKKGQRNVVWAKKPDGPDHWDGKAMTVPTDRSDGKIRHRSFWAHLHRSKSKMQKGLDQIQESKIVRQFMFPFDEEEIKKDLDTMQRHCDTVDHVVGRVTADLATKNLEETQQVRTEAARFHEKTYERRDFKDFRNIVEWLSPMSFREVYHNHLDPLNGPMIDSSWLLRADYFQDWFGGRPWRLFIFGESGSGKSMVSTHIIDNLMKIYSNDPDTVVLYLFLDYQERKAQTLQYLMASLLRQIVDRYGAQRVPEQVKELWKQEAHSTRRPPTKEVSRLLAAELGKLKRTYIIIDGLDEATDDTRKSLMHETFKLAQTCNSPNVNGKVSLIYTSRRLDQISKSTEKQCEYHGDQCPGVALRIFYKCKNTKGHGHHFHLCRQCVASGKHCKDFPHQLIKLPEDRLDIDLLIPEDSIRKFVEALIDEELARGAAKRSSIATNDSSSVNGLVYGGKDETTFIAREIRANPKLRMDIVDTIVENAGGLYMLAAMQWKSVHHSKSPKDIDDALKDLPKDLGSSYAKTLDRMIDGNVSPNDQIRAKRVVLWASHARRKLTLDEFMTALSIAGDEEGMDPQDIIALTRGFVVVGDADQRVRLVHRTAYEYLDTAVKIKKTWFPDGEKPLALVCLKALTDARLKEPVKGTERDELIRDRIAKMRLTAYAAQHWGFHARSCQDDAEVAELIRILLTEDGYLASALQISTYCEQDRPTGWDQDKGVSPLHVAAWFGLESMITTQVANDVDIDDPENNSKGRTPLIYACRGGRPEAIHKLVSLGADVNKCDIDKLRGFPPLAHAALTENVAAVKALCSYDDVDVNIRLPAGRTVLMQTASAGYIPELNVLLKRKDLEVNLQDDYGAFTALMLAAQKDSVETIKTLLSIRGIDTEKKTNTGVVTGSTALHYAAELGKDKIVQVLLENNADSAARDSHGGTPLRRAIDHGQQAVIEVYKDQGLLSTVGTEDESGKDYLFSAAVNGHSSVVQDLINAGFDVNSRDPHGQTPLHDAAGSSRLSASRKLEVVKTLIGAGADKGLKNDNDMTASDLAYENGDIDVGDLINPLPGSGYGNHEEKDLPATSLAHRGLLKALEAKDDSELTEPNTEGETPLAVAIYSQKYDCVEPILAAYARQGRDIDTPSVYNRTPLHEAAKSTYDWLVKKLLAHSPRPAVDSIDSLGLSPLSEAINSGNTESVMALIEAGAKFDRFHAPTEIMLTAAIEADKLMVARAMIDSGADVRPSHRSLAKDKGNSDMMMLLELQGA